jgi:hypothetical protein
MRCIFVLRLPRGFMLIEIGLVNTRVTLQDSP